MTIPVETPSQSDRVPVCKEQGFGVSVSWRPRGARSVFTPHLLFNLVRSRTGACIRHPVLELAFCLSYSNWLEPGTHSHPQDQNLLFFSQFEYEVQDANSENGPLLQVFAPCGAQHVILDAACILESLSRSIPSPLHIIYVQLARASVLRLLRLAKDVRFHTTFFNDKIGTCRPIRYICHNTYR